jgi:hypothetical protein
LANAAFAFFSGGSAASSNQNTSPFVELLTRGVLEGLWPGAMIELVSVRIFKAVKSLTYI